MKKKSKIKAGDMVFSENNDIFLVVKVTNKWENFYNIIHVLSNTGSLEARFAYSFKKLIS